jgi:uncharacterized protein
MKILRRVTLGGVLAAFVYFASACAKGNEEPSVEPNLDGGGEAGDAGKDATKPRVEDSGVDPDPDPDAGPTCTGKIVVNELMTAGTSAADEFVELYNTASCAISMGGWKLSYRASSGNLSVGGLHTFVAGTQIPAKSFFVIGGDAFTGKKDATLSGAMAADRGQVALLDDQGKVIDGVAYGTQVMTDAGAGTYAEKTPAQAPLASASIARKSDGLDTDDNAADFARASPHTAGASNQ